MVRELSAYYLLGYTSTIGARDGKFHPIQVRVKRPGVEVRARKGYWAFTEDEVRRASAPPKAGPPAEMSNALEELAGVVEPSSRRGVSVWIGSARGRGGEGARHADLGGTARPVQDPIDKVARISVVATAGGGRSFSRAQWSRIRRPARVAGRVSFDAPAGLVRLRRPTENSSGQRIENEDLSYEVPDFTAAHPMISTPGVSSAHGPPRDHATASGDRTPLPTVTRQFSRTERLLVRFDAYGPGRHHAEADSAAAQPHG